MTKRRCHTGKERHFSARKADLRGNVDFSVPGGLDGNEVVEIIRRVNHPVRLDDLLRLLDLSRREKTPLGKMLDLLEAEGRVLRLHGGRWIAAEQASLITGTLSIQRSGAGFVTPDTVDQKDQHGYRKQSSDIFVRAELLGDAWHGDRVEVVLQPGSERKRKGVRHAARSTEGRIVRVLERGLKEIAAHATRRTSIRGLLCRPADPRLNFILDTDLSALAEQPVPGELLLIRPEEKQRPGIWSGVALSSLGREDDASVQERLTKLNHQIPLEFPPNVLAAARILENVNDRDGLPLCGDVGTAPSSASLPFASSGKRQDLRGIPFVTIDGEDARDFDDAIYVQPILHGGMAVWELWVAIADVSHFVRTGSVLDREARERGNSCYFPTSVEPMLPEILSNGLCSLRPGEDRLVMAARIRFDEHGEPRSSVFFPGLIRSRARLTYEAVQAAFDNEKGGETAGKDGRRERSDSRENSVSLEADTKAEGILAAHPWLADAYRLAGLLWGRRLERGSLDFDLPEARYVVSDGRVTNLVRRERFFAHRLVEEFMLAANEAVARFLTQKGIPFPCRIHPAPDPDRLRSLFRTLLATGLFSEPELAQWNQREETPDPGSLRGILEEAKGTPREDIVGRLVLRSMMQARYSPEVGEHFGLASACYCHFTSPIRRYADLLVHRALHHALGAEQPVVSGGKLLAFTDQCNARERVATDAEREVVRRFACLLLRERAGETFSGTVSGVTEFGFFVELEAMPVEGMVRLEALRYDWFEYDPDRQSLTGVGTGRRFQLGQRMVVRLVDVHIGRLEINLEPVESKGTGKRSRPGHSSGVRARKEPRLVWERNAFSHRRKR